MSRKSSTQYLFFVLFFSSLLISQVKINSVQSIAIGKRGLIQNPVWSSDSKKIAFEFLIRPINSQISVKNITNEILIYEIGSKNKAKNLVKENTSGSTLFEVIDKLELYNPIWSKKEKSTLYFLYVNLSRRLFLGKLSDLAYSNIPISLDGSEKTNIDQGSGTAEYHTEVFNNLEYIFMRQINSPQVIDYSYDDGDLWALPDFEKKLQDDEIIDSFSLSKGMSKIVICKGNGNKKTFIIGELNISDDDIDSIHYMDLPIKKEKNVVLQDPSFNPIDDNKIAYIMMEYYNATDYKNQLHYFTLRENRNVFITDSLYRNRDKLFTRSNSVSYAWHPNGKYIFFIKTDDKRNISYVDLNDSDNPIIRTIATDIEHADQLSISPNGKYLTVMTEIPSKKNKTNAVGELYILELQY